jgi:phospholipase/carboxylesterase
VTQAAVEQYIESLTPIGIRTLTVLSGLEAAQRKLHPPLIPALRERLAPHRDALSESLADFAASVPPEPLAAFHRTFVEGAERAREAVDQFVRPTAPEETIIRVLASMKSFARALETLYKLVRFPPLSQYFLEEPVRAEYARFDVERAADAAVGLQMSGGPEDPAGRGNFALYGPENYDGESALALVVALHGGSGSGREFVWCWLREARSRGFLLVAPTSVGPTWDLFTGRTDQTSLARMVEYVAERYRVDRDKILLTGLSDGATYTLLGGLAEGSPFTHLAPISGVFHPASEENGNLARAAGRPIYLVHGALDWMFPVAGAREAAQTLERAGAAIVYREIDDLSHTYPREENAAILEWLDPGLTLPV